jgi:hypothetical protein
MNKDLIGLILLFLLLVAVVSVIVVVCVRPPEKSQYAHVSLVWNQTFQEVAMIFNTNENRAVPLQVVKNFGKDFEVDSKTGFVTFLGTSEVIVKVNYTITLKLPEITSQYIQHFIGLNPNESWKLASPSPSIALEESQNYIKDEITLANEKTVTTLSLIASFPLLPNQSFGLCANIADTNNSTIYMHVSCIVNT